MTNIFAYTAPGTAYPEFVSINLNENGHISVTVREKASVDGACGQTVTVDLPMSMTQQFREEINEFFSR